MRFFYLLSIFTSVSAIANLWGRFSTSCFIFPLSFWCFLAPSFIGIHHEIVVFDSFSSELRDISGFSDGFIFGGKSKNVGCAVEKLSGFGVAVLFVWFTYLFIYLFIYLSIYLFIYLFWISLSLDKHVANDDRTISSVIGILGTLLILQEN